MNHSTLNKLEKEIARATDRWYQSPPLFAAVGEFVEAGIDLSARLIWNNVASRAFQREMLIQSAAVLLAAVDILDESAAVPPIPTREFHE